MLIRTSSNRQSIVSCCHLAAARGVRPRQMLAQARANCPLLRVVEHEPLADRQALLAVARWCFRFTPIVQLDLPDLPDDANLAHHNSLHFEPKAAHPRKQLRTRSKLLGFELAHHTCLYLDLTGSAHLFGGADPTIRLIQSAFRRFCITCRIAPGLTPGHAHALTFQTHSQISSALSSALSPIPPHSIPSHRRSAQTPAATSLNHLPVAALRLNDLLLSTLHHLGVHTIGLLRALPRDKLPARLGTLALKRLDQLDGKLAEPLTPVEPFAPILIKRHWDFSVDSIDTLRPVFDDILARLTRELHRRGRGVTHALLTLSRHYEEPLIRDLRFARPASNVKDFLRLIQLSTDHFTQETAKKKGRRTVKTNGDVIAPAGFTAAEIRVVTSVPLVQQQTQFIDTQDEDLRTAAVHLTESLVSRLGNPSVARADPVESFLPERAWHELPAISHQSRAHHNLPEHATSPLPWLDAPLRLHAPIEVRAVVSPSEDRDGKPIQITWPSGRVTPIPHAVGPIRVSGEWWRDHTKTRDYFHIHDNQGQYYFLFRVLDSSRWFLQGQ